MHYKKEQVEVLYEVLSLSNEVDEVFLPTLINTLKKEKTQDCLKFLSQDQNKFLLEIESQKVETQSLLEKESTLNGEKNIKIITDVLKKVMDHDFNTQNYSMDDYEEFKMDLTTQITLNKKIIEFLKFLVHLTAFDETYIWCGSNSLHLLVQMKVDLREQCFENIRIRNTSLVGGNFVRCIFNGSEFDNVDISGMNLNQAQLINCNWKNIKIHELKKLKGHNGSVNQVCFSLDGKSLASCSDDNLIRLWDVKTGKIKSRIKVKGQVKSVCFSHNESTLAFSSGKVVYLWNLKTRKQQAKLNGHFQEVSSICFSSNGAKLVSGGGDKFICVWDVKTGQQKAKLYGHSNAVQSICYSPDGTTLASGSKDTSIRLRDVKTGQQKAKLDGSVRYLHSFLTHQNRCGSSTLRPEYESSTLRPEYESLFVFGMQKHQRKYLNQIVAIKFCLPSLTYHFRIAPYCQMLILIVQYLESVRFLCSKHQEHLSYKDNS
ncbi:unnamed protein product [Paramecium octaurelia]|uniref:Uncharacterized protein n=1 Tax=Paramecium octaurelia TaxID=43137 RepID=A0A8S1TQ06_PAROT|nr:unnamed protein product [Paramecium octaurelia]